MSPTLQSFYTEMQEWIDDGCPEHYRFKHRFGLCLNLKRYCDSLPIDMFRKIGLYMEMEYSFCQHNLHPAFPFNYGRIELFDSERNLYENPFRLYWVQTMAEST